jgi:hypothetical protein
VRGISSCDKCRRCHPAASATQHPSSRVMLAAIKFFLGQDEAEDAGSDDDEDGGGGSRKQESGAATPPAAPSSKEVYAAKSKVGPSCNTCLPQCSSRRSKTLSLH